MVSAFFILFENLLLSTLKLRFIKRSCFHPLPSLWVSVYEVKNVISPSPSITSIAGNSDDAALVSQTNADF